MTLVHAKNVQDNFSTPEAVKDINELFHQSDERRVSSIELIEPETQFRVSNMVRACCQSYLWRLLDLIVAAETLRTSGHELGSRILLRSFIETIASFCHFERQFQRKLETMENKNDLDQIHDFILGKTFATRIPELLSESNFGERSRAVHSNTQLKVLAKMDPTIQQVYDHLCEDAHPNAFGTFLFYASFDKKNQVADFSNESHDPNETLILLLHVTNLLKFYNESFDNIEARLAELSAFGAKIRLASEDVPGWYDGA